MDLCKTAEWIVARNLPVSEVDDPLTRGMLRVSPVSSKTLLGYMRHVSTKVGDRITATMGDAFGIMSDGWSSGTTHFVAIYAVYTVKDENGVDVLKQPLLAISPTEYGQAADAHIEMIENVLDVYGKTTDMLLFVVEDNCATNQAEIIDQVQALCVQLRLPNNSATLARLTPLKPLKAITTRWSSMFQMLQRYIALRDAIKEVPAVEDLVPRPSMHRKIVQLVEQLADLDSVCVQLQAEECTMSDARLLFDAVIEKYPATQEQLETSARIVHTPSFESAIVKVQRDHPLSAAETTALARFEVERQAPPTTCSTNFAVHVLRQAKRARTTVTASCSALVQMIPPTSNRCERLFSQCKLVLTPHRASMVPANFEMLVFLRANRDLWGYASFLGYNEEEE